VDCRAHTVGRMKKWVTAVAVLAALAGMGLLVHWQWDAIWAVVFSPIGGLVTKILFTGKALKVIAGVTFAVGAGVVAMRKKMRRGTPEPEPEYAPPVYGPPDGITSGETATATTTESATVPASRPI
jgi:hypothetical protein